MKKLLILFCGLLGTAACSDDKTDPVPGAKTPLEVTLDATELARGETLTATVRIVREDETEASPAGRQDLTLWFEAIEEGKYAALFEQSFPAEVIFRKELSELAVEFPVKTDVEGAHTVRLWVSAEGTPIAGASQEFTVSDYHYVTFSVAEQDDNEVSEGKTFRLQASIVDPAPEDLTLTLSASGTGAAGDDFEGLPLTMTLPKGATSVVSAEIAVREDDGEYFENRTWNFTGTVSAAGFRVEAFDLVRVDSDTQKGDKLTDERWVYDDPAAPFYSAETETKYLTCPSFSADGVKMTRSAAAGQGSQHPNKQLAAAGWTLLNAVEFHAIEGWSFSRSAKNANGICPVAVANGWGAQNTAKVETNCFINNDKYTNVTDEGYLRMWAAKDEGTDGRGNARHFGAAALYANKGTGTAIPQNTVIAEGTRIEIRARMRGKLQGFNYAFWLQGNNSAIEWPAYGEIDVLENPVSQTNVAGTANTVHQTLHWGTVVDGAHANPTVSNTVDASVWNIYWVEIVDATTIRMGINGLTTRVFTAADNATGNAYDWPFSNAQNPKGFHVLLTPGVASDWTGSMNGMSQADIDAGMWADAAFRAMTYEQSKTSDDAPRMEVDWIRYWKKDNYTDMGVAVNAAAKMF